MGVRTGSMTSPNHTTLVAGSSVTSKNPCLLTPYPEHFSNCPAASFRGLLKNMAKLWGGLRKERREGLMYLGATDMLHHAVPRQPNLAQKGFTQVKQQL